MKALPGTLKLNRNALGRDDESQKWELSDNFSAHILSSHKMILVCWK